MNRKQMTLALLLVGAGVCSASREARAQQLLMPRIGGYNAVQEDPLPNPTVSPWLLMTDVGQTGMLNYQTLVQPLMQQRPRPTTRTRRSTTCNNRCRA